VKPHGAAAAWLRQLGPSQTSSERTFRHGVSPSPKKSDRSSGAVHLSQVSGGSNRPTRGEGNRVRAHVWTNPACSWDGETSNLGKIFKSVLVQARSRRPISPAPEGERASLEGSLILLAIATKEKGASRGKRLPSNRWVGWVEKDRPGGRVSLGKAHVPACAGLGG